MRMRFRISKRIAFAWSDRNSLILWCVVSHFTTYGGRYSFWEAALYGLCRPFCTILSIVVAPVRMLSDGFMAGYTMIVGLPSLMFSKCRPGQIMPSGCRGWILPPGSGLPGALWSNF
ncbi:hypothetical protein AVEN_96195-1 [Araneus ventricosus]|uniref:Uncharacterized protein n=1 Tax=Araneus ventricosus TaxID=182803 RepID=A0A4Y2FV56_ARAVE|nr:hypothetical protein AVEN_96195-1 [Araneus ventricosus]